MSIYKHEAEQFVTKKALGCCNEDCEILGIEHSHLNINLPALMMVKEDDDSISFTYDAKTYYFCSEAVQKVDETLLEYWKYGISCTAVLLNAPKLFDSRNEKALLDKVIHPDFEWDVPDAYISAFAVEKEESCGYFRAFIAFLSERYMRDDAKYGRITGFIISNEVNSQCVWGNAGSKPVEVYVKEYAKALREAWLVSHKYWEHVQIYISLDHHWTEGFRPQDTLRAYGGKDVLDLVNKYVKEQGDFGWGVAYHPYPEALNYPDFYNDRIPTFCFDTRIITFKNIEVLGAYLGQDEFLYNGQKRSVIFSEQGFNARSRGFVEDQQAAAYILAYQKMKKMPQVQWMTHHAYLDNPHEFGLHLGIRERKENGKPGRKRPIYRAIKAMGTPDEEKYVAWARRFIGKQLFDELLSPTVTKDADHSKENEFGD
jgi:hypothetical protein